MNASTNNAHSPTHALLTRSILSFSLVLSLSLSTLLRAVGYLKCLTTVQSVFQPLEASQIQTGSSRPRPMISMFVFGHYTIKSRWGDYLISLQVEMVRLFSYNRFLFIRFILFGFEFSVGLFNPHRSVRDGRLGFLFGASLSSFRLLS